MARTLLLMGIALLGSCSNRPEKAVTIAHQSEEQTTQPFATPPKGLSEDEPIDELSSNERAVLCSVNHDGTGFPGAPAVNRAFSSSDVPRLVSILNNGDFAPCWQGTMMTLGELLADKEYSVLLDFLDAPDVDAVKSATPGLEPGALLLRGLFALNALQQVARRHPGSRQIREFALQAVDVRYWMSSSGQFGLVHSSAELDRAMPASEYASLLASKSVLVLATLTSDSETRSRLNGLANSDTAPISVRTMARRLTKGKRQ